VPSYKLLRFVCSKDGRHLTSHELLRVILYFDWVTFLPVKLWWRRVFLHFRFVESRIPVIKYQQIYENQMYTQFNILVHLYYLGGECHIFHTLCIKNSSIFVHLYLSNRGILHFLQSHQWCHAHLECSRLWIWAQIGSNQRLWN
jgi:hypothetical protein